MTVVLENGTYLYNHDSAIEYLSSLGMNHQDIEAFVDLLLPDEYQEFLSGDYVLRDSVDDWERFYCGLTQEVQDFQMELTAICEKLASGKGGTKKQYAEKILKKFEECIDII